MNKILVIIFVFLFSTVTAYSQSNDTAEIVQGTINFNPNVEYGYFIDSRDNRSYKTVKIGHQIWMAENLAYLPSINSIHEESFTKPIYYIYGYHGSNINEAIITNNYKTYAVLYNFVAALKACPNGWHLPSHGDWDLIIDELKWNSTAGAKMKENGTNHWINNNISTTNESGLTILPGGSVLHKNDWDDLGIKSNLWGSKVRDEENAHAISLANSSSWAAGSFFPKNSGLSVRCLKD